MEAKINDSLDQRATPEATSPLAATPPADFPLHMDQKGDVLKQIKKLLANNKGIDETEAKQLRKTMDDLGELDSTVDPDKTILKKSEQLRVRIHKQVERREKDYEAACLMMDELEAAVKKNELTVAEQKEKKIISLVSRIPGLSEKRSQGLEKRLKRARPKLSALESWRHWGTTQAREDLLDQMKQLDGTRLSPDKLAKTIRDARDQWREWEKSGDHSNKKLWQEFDAACEKAYEPCAAHFDKLKAERNENRQKAQDLLDNLSAYYDAVDWKHPEWKAIDKQLRFSRRDFFKVGHVDFKHRKKLRAQLDQLNEQFEAHLSRERERCLKAREKLITDAEALAELEDSRDAITQLDAIRKQWVPTVLEKRGLENALWKRFQAAGDTVYARRDNQRKEQFAERDEHLKQKSALVEELMTLSQADARILLSQRSKVTKIKDQWHTIGSVPRKVEKNLQNRWRDAQKQCQTAMKAAQNQAKNAEQTKLIDKARLCGQIEQKQLAGEDHSELLSQLQILAAQSNDADEKAIQKRIIKVSKEQTAEILKKNQTTIEDACLQLELMLEIESPAAFAKQRMAFQIARLRASMKKNAAAQATPSSLITNILTTGAVSVEAYPALQSRIEVCLKKQI